jgi:hypothetical protein
MSSATWKERAPFCIGTQLGARRISVYSIDEGATWQVNVEEGQRIVEHAEGFPTKGHAIAYALEVTNEEAPRESQPDTGRERLETTREVKVTPGSVMVH